MAEFQLTEEQEKIKERDLRKKVFLSGAVGCGKTTAAVAHLEYLFTHQIIPETVMVLVPQRTLAKPYYDFVNGRRYTAIGEPTILTLGGLARRMIDLFWPMVATSAGFSSGSPPATFLTIETAQYFLSRVMEPLLAKGYFSGINIDRNRLASQILDNMNKAAVVGFPLEEIGTRLRDGSPGDANLWIAFQQAEECALLFREHCLKYNLLDYSLQMEVFNKIVWPTDLCRNFVTRQFRHLIYDNIEEDVPVAHDWVKDWSGELDSALFVFDDDGGYRTFLGADPESGKSLEKGCDETFEFKHRHTSTPGLQELQAILNENILFSSKPTPPPGLFEQFTFIQSHFYPEMIDDVCQKIQELINEQKESAKEMVILAPFLSDSLLFSLSTRLADYQIPSYSARPSRTMMKEPVISCLVTFAKLAYPSWGLPVDTFEMRQALMTSIRELDAARAQLCCQALFKEKHIEMGLGSFNNLKGELPERITYVIGNKLEKIRNWIEEYKQNEALPLFGFWSKIFGELLSQPEFGLHQDFNAADLAAKLILSEKKFRQIFLTLPDFEENNCSREYLTTLQSGLIGAQFFENEGEAEPEAVLIAPAFTYLMTNRAVKFQFWLDIGSNGWWERLNQPLTHPYVLNRHWHTGNVWQDGDEIKANQQSLARLVRGLLNRCNQHLYLYTAGMDNQGREQRNQLLQAFNLIYRRAVNNKANDHV